MGRGLWPTTSPMGAHFFSNMHKRLVRAAALYLCISPNFKKTLDFAPKRVYNYI